MAKKKKVDDLIGRIDKVLRLDANGAAQRVALIAKIVLAPLVFLILRLLA